MKTMDKALVNVKQKRLLWVDLEMTGLDPKKDRILEVAAIVTDWSFKEIDTFEASVNVGAQTIRKRMIKGPSAEFYNSFPDVRDALIKNSRESDYSSCEVEEALLEFVAKHFKEGVPIILAGNSIHQDRKFIDNEWQDLSGVLHYRMLDVSAWKIVFEGKYKKKFAKRESHRALEDIRGSIEELQYYLKLVKG